MIVKRHEEKIQGHRRTRVGTVLYALAVIVLAIAIIILSFLLLFFVQNIKISGNLYADKYDIARVVQNDMYSNNSFYVWCKYKMGKGESLPCLDDIEVGLSKPWELSVKVREKEIVGYVFLNDTKYAYFDREGQVVWMSSDYLEEIPYVEGLNVTEEIKLYDFLKSDDETLHKEIMETCAYFTKGPYSEVKIAMKEGSIYVYFDEICVSLGKRVTTEQMDQIEPALTQINAQKGTLHLENYSATKKTLTFDVGTILE